jgi:hypothetical protein
MWALLATVSFFATIGVHVIVCHGVSRGGALVKFLFTGSLMGAALAIQSYSRYGFGAETVASLLAFAMACEFYIFLFTMVSGSISVSLLLALRKGPVLVDKLPALYSSYGMISRRFEKLTKSGLLEHRRGRYMITGKGRRIVAAFQRLRLFFGHVE